MVSSRSSFLMELLAINLRIDYYIPRKSTSRTTSAYAIGYLPDFSRGVTFVLGLTHSFLFLRDTWDKNGGSSTHTYTRFSDLLGIFIKARWFLWTWRIIHVKIVFFETRKPFSQMVPIASDELTPPLNSNSKQVRTLFN